MDQRRQHPRLDIRMGAEIQREDGTFTAVTRNLSVGGAALSAPRPMTEGELLRLSLFVVVEDVEDARMPALAVGARVMWTGQADDGSYQAGVRFETLTAAQRGWLERFLKLSE